MRHLPLLLLLTACSPQPADPERAVRQSNAAARAERELDYHRYTLTTAGEGRYQAAIKLDTRTGAAWIYQPGTFEDAWRPIDQPATKPLKK